jgi:hypothetical protein
VLGPKPLNSVHAAASTRRLLYTPPVHISSLARVHRCAVNGAALCTRRRRGRTQSREGAAEGASGTGGNAGAGSGKSGRRGARVGGVGQEWAAWGKSGRRGARVGGVGLTLVRVWGVRLEAWDSD